MNKQFSLYSIEFIFLWWNNYVGDGGGDGNEGDVNGDDGEDDEDGDADNGNGSRAGGQQMQQPYE